MSLCSYDIPSLDIPFPELPDIDLHLPFFEVDLELIGIDLNLDIPKIAIPFPVLPDFFISVVFEFDFELLGLDLNLDIPVLVIPILALPDIELNLPFFEAFCPLD